MQLYESYFWRLEKCVFNGMRVVNADAGPEQQYIENIWAGLRWVALREKGINDVCVCVYVSMKLGLTVRVKYITRRTHTHKQFPGWVMGSD